MKPIPLAACAILFTVCGVQAQDLKKGLKDDAATCLIEAEWPLIEEISIKTRLSQPYLKEVVGIIVRDLENPEFMIQAYRKVAEDFGDDPSGLSASRRAECLEPLLSQ